MPTSTNLEDLEYIENKSPFTCKICLSEIQPGDGIILKDCCHRFCKICISNVIKFSSEAEIRCPYVSEEHWKCTGIIQDRELRCFISDKEYSRYLQKSLSQAENSNQNAFHCKTPNCIGWFEITGPTVKSFRCPTCRKMNCVSCKAVHEGITCMEFRGQRTTDTQKSNNLIRNLLREKKIMKCPKCGILVQKTRGCNHLKCLKCNHDFQWIGRTGFEWVR